MTCPNLGNGGGSLMLSGKILIAKNCLRQKFLKSKIQNLNLLLFASCIYHCAASQVQSHGLNNSIFD